MSDKRALAAARNKRWREKNRARVNAQQRARYDPEKWRQDHLKRAYGITEADYLALFEAQAGRCAICLAPPNRRLHVDHDHGTGEIRGLLCGNCNRMLGLAKDRPEVLESAASYLRKHSQ